MTESILFNYAALGAYFFAAVIHLIILRSILSRFGKSIHETFLSVLILSLSVYFMGFLGGQFIRIAFGAAFLGLTKLLFLTAVIGVSMIPPMLICLFFAYYSSMRERVNFPGPIAYFSIAMIPTIALWVTGLPGVSLSGSIELNPFTGLGLDHLIVPYIIWLAISLIMSAGIALKIRAETAESHLREFTGVITVLFTGIVLFQVSVFVLDLFSNTGIVREYLILLASISGLLPTLVLGYYIYRFKFLSLVIKPGMIYTVLTGFILSVYLVVIKSAGSYLEGIRGINSVFVEGILLLALILLTQPLKNRLYVYTTNIFFRERVHYQELLKELTDKLTKTADLSELLNLICSSLKDAFELEGVTVIAWLEEGSEVSESAGKQTLMSSIPRSLERVKKIGSLIRRTGELEQNILDEFEVSGMEMIVPLGNQREISGLIILCNKKTGEKFHSEEISMVETLATQSGNMIEKLHLFQEKLEFETELNRAGKLSTIGMLTASISHEVKNPLSSMGAIIRSMREEQITGSEMESELGVVENELNRLKKYVGEILNYSKPDEGVKETVLLTEAINDVMLIINAEARYSNVELILEKIDKDLVLNTGIDNIKEILLNLTINGIESIKNGGVVRVSADVEDEMVEIAVTDTGAGIGQKEIEMLYDPFYTSKAGSTGLGLTIVKRKLKEIGGSIKFDSKPGVGTTVKIFIPGFKSEER